MKRFFKRTLLFPLFLLLTHALLAQTNTVTGRVFSDDKQTPLEGAAVSVKDTAMVPLPIKTAHSR